MQTIITNLNYTETIKILEKKYNCLANDGCFFAIVRTEYDEKNNVDHDFLDVINYAVEIGYEYINTIVYPSRNNQLVSFIDNVKYVVWLAKNRSSMLFNKDAIREKHIWKDVEWGKRAKNYNPKGKDPGNVWIPTEDDGKAKITRHIILEDEGVIQRLIKMSKCGDDYCLFNEPLLLKTPAYKQSKKNGCETNQPTKQIVYFKSSENMDEIENDSVKTIVTSPPYWDLKDYYKEGQIGQEPYESYLYRMKKVWTECFHKLRNDGSLWININIRVRKGKVIPIPYDLIRSCKEIGFFYKGILIWHKSSGIPTGEKNIVDRHEYVLLFSKNELFSVNMEKFKLIADYKNKYINGSAFWNINRKAGSVGKKYIHPAIFPNDLVGRIIDISSSPGDVVMDPFLGSGTSLIAAYQDGRNFLGYEYYEGFQELMESRFETEIPDATVEFKY